jgi:hypothetical protein
MATPGELCAKTSEILGLEPNTPSIAWRALREGAHVTTGGRGRSAAHCVPADAASLLIATIGKMPLKSYLKSWERFSNLKERLVGPRTLRKSTAAELDALEFRHTFQEGLTALIASAMTGSLQSFIRDPLIPNNKWGDIRVAFNGPFPQAGIQIRKEIEKAPVELHLWYSDRIIKWPNPSSPPDESGDLAQSMAISGRTIVTLGEFLRTGEAK